MHVRELGVGVGKIGERGAAASGEIARVIVGRVGQRLASGQGAAAGVVEEGDELLVVRRGALPETLALQRGEIEPVEKGTGARRGSAVAAQINAGAVGSEANRRAAKWAGLHDGLARVAVSVLGRAVEYEARGGAGLRGIELPSAGLARANPAFYGEGAMGVAPDHAVAAVGEFHHADGIAGERRGQQHELVAKRSLAPGVAFIAGLEPRERCRSIGAPRNVARAAPHRVGLDGNLISERQFGDYAHALPGGGPDFDALGKTHRGQRVGKRPVQRGDDNVATIGRRRRVDEAANAE